MRKLLGHAVFVASACLLCVLVTMSAAALAVHGSRDGSLSKDTGSSLTADYSADAFGAHLAPLDSLVIQAATQDEAVLQQSSGRFQRREPLLISTPTPVAPTPTPGATATPAAVTPTAVAATATVFIETPTPAAATPTPVILVTPTAVALTTPTPAPEAATPPARPEATETPDAPPPPTSTPFAAQTPMPTATPRPQATSTPYVLQPPTPTPFFRPLQPTAAPFAPIYATPTRTPTPPRGFAATATPTRAAPTPTSAPGSTPTVLPSPTMVATSTPTPSPVPTMTPTPTATPQPPPISSLLLHRGRTGPGNAPHNMSSNSNGNPLDTVDVAHGTSELFRSSLPVSVVSGGNGWSLTLVLRDKPSLSSPVTLAVWSEAGGCSNPNAVSTTQVYAAATATVPGGLQPLTSVTIPISGTGAPPRALTANEKLCLSIAATGGSGNNDIHFYTDTLALVPSTSMSNLQGPFTGG